MSVQLLQALLHQKVRQLELCKHTGEPLAELLVRIANDSAFHLASRVLLLASSILAIPLMFALFQLIHERRTSYRLISLVALVLGIAAMASFAISHIVIVPLSTDIAERYLASTGQERKDVLVDAQRIDESIGLTAFDNIFMKIGIPLLLASLVIFGLIMVRISLFERWIGLLTVIFGGLSFVAIMMGNVANRGGIEVIPATALAFIWFIIIGYRIAKTRSGVSLNRS